MHAPSKTAVGGSDHPLTPHQAGKAQDAIGHQLGMLDHVGGVADDARQDQLLVWQLHLLPYPPFVGMPLMAWLSASTRRMENLRYSSTVGSGLIMSQFSAMAGSSSCSMRPASTMALYSSRMASAQAKRNSSSVL